MLQIVLAFMAESFWLKIENGDLHTSLVSKKRRNFFLCETIFFKSRFLASKILKTLELYLQINSLKIISILET